MPDQDSDLKKLCSLEDYGQIAFIGEQLGKTNNEYGMSRVAVMVGSGFSLNADKLSPGARAFPTWNDLADRLFERFYPEDSFATTGKQDQKKREYAGTSGILRLAGEFCHFHSEAELNRVIKDSVPNDQYQPGELHKILLDLPWADVLTTNWDTLLERTGTAGLSQRRYSKIYTKEDIPIEPQPRIIKLHGTLPSHTPFILTEEHFRTYPEKSAPFINLARQVLLENTLVLIGFSGSDPNFLAWLGWVRDCLGGYSNRCYMVNLSGVSPHQKSYLHSLGINTIDLSMMLPQNEPNRYPRMLAALFSCWKKRMDEQAWPTMAVRHVDDADDADLVQDLINTWKRDRENYPGWIIPQRDKVKIIHADMKQPLPFNALENIDPMKNVDPKIAIQFLYEALTRMDLGMMLLPDSVATECLRHFSYFNPFPGDISISEARYRPDTPDCADWDWAVIREQWGYTGLYLLRWARFKMEREKFESFSRYLEPYAKTNSIFAESLAYERCLFLINTLDFKGASSFLQENQFLFSTPFGMVQRVALLAEIGDYEEACREIPIALTRIRESSLGINDKKAGTEELSALFLHRVLLSDLQYKRDSNGHRTTEAQEISKDFWSRSEDMKKRLNISLMDELERWSASIPTPFIEMNSFITKKKVKGFDPGTSFSIRQCLPLQGDEFYGPFAFLRIYEKIARPYLIGDRSFNGKDLPKAIEWLLPDFPRWALLALVRAGGANGVERATRVRLVLLEKEDVTFIYECLKNSIIPLLPNLERRQVKGQFVPINVQPLHVVSGALELLSRLCMRLDMDQKQDLCGIAEQCYKAVEVQRQIDLYAPLRNLFRRLFRALEQDELFRWMPTLFSLPIDERLSRMMRDHKWPDPFEVLGFIQEYPSLPTEDSPMASVIASSVKSFLTELRSPDAPIRESALYKLYQLYTKKMLNDSQRISFFEGVWGQTDEHGLPKGVCALNPVIALDLQDESEHNVSELLRAYFADWKPVTFDGKGGGTHHDIVLMGMRDAYRSACQDESKRLINWQEEEMREVWDKISAWCTSYKEAVKEIDAYLLQVVSLLNISFLPALLKMDIAKDEIKSLRSDVFDLVKKGDSSLLALRPFLLTQEEALSEQITKDFLEGLRSRDKTIAQHALFGSITWWVWHSQGILNIPIDEELKREIFVFVGNPRKADLFLYAVDSLTSLAQSCADSLTGQDIKLMEPMLRGLFYDLQLPEKWGYCFMPSSSSAWNQEWIPDFQAMTVQFACQLSKLNPNVKEWAEKTLEDWHQLALKSPLPEVRRAWSD